MKTKKILTILVLALSLMVCSVRVSDAESMGTGFSYQGRLIDNNDAADGLYDFQFKLFDSSTDGNQVNGDVNIPGLDVIDGYFTVELDFGGNVFDGDARWLEIGVRPGEFNDSNAYTILSPRQGITATPYALYAKNTSGDNDWMVFGDDMYSIPSGNVGIGTTTPEKKLDIASDSYTDLGIGLSTNTPGGTSWSIDNDGGVFKIAEHASCGPEFLNNTRIAVVGNCIGSPYGGNVGIGTENPGAKLEVNGQVKITGGSPAEGKVLTSDVDGLASWQPAADSDWTVSDSNMYSAVSGNVGIGTTSPSAGLDVNTTVKIGSNGILFSEIIELTGTTNPTGDHTNIDYPSGWNQSNTRVLNLEIYYNNDIWIGLGYYWPAVYYSVGYGLRSDNIYIVYPEGSTFQNKPYRMLLMKRD